MPYFSRFFAIVFLACNYALALFGVFAWTGQAPIGDFWHIEGDLALCVVLHAVCVHMIMYFDESFGLRTTK